MVRRDGYRVSRVRLFPKPPSVSVGGVRVMLLGAEIAVASKSPMPGQHFD